MGVSGEIASLANLTTLSKLYLSQTRVSGDVAPLALLTSLTVLDLHGTQVSGDVAPLAALTALSELNITETNVSGDTAYLPTSLNSPSNLSLSKTITSVDGHPGAYGTPMPP